jgi:hypothetical protein
MRPAWRWEKPAAAQIGLRDWRAFLKRRFDRWRAGSFDVTDHRGQLVGMQRLEPCRAAEVAGAA